MWFRGASLESLGRVDLGAAVGPPDVVVQRSVREAPGLTGAHVLTGGIRAPEYAVPLRLEGVGPSTAVADLQFAANWRTIRSWVGSAGELIDSNGEVHEDAVLVAVTAHEARRFAWRNGQAIAAMNVVLHFVLTQGLDVR